MHFFPKAFVSTLGKHAHLSVVSPVHNIKKLYKAKQSVMPVLKEQYHRLKIFYLITKYTSGISDPTTTYKLI